MDYRPLSANFSNHLRSFFFFSHFFLLLSSSKSSRLHRAGASSFTQGLTVAAVVAQDPEEATHPFTMKRQKSRRSCFFENLSFSKLYRAARLPLRNGCGQLLRRRSCLSFGGNTCDEFLYDTLVALLQLAEGLNYRSKYSPITTARCDQAPKNRATEPEMRNTEGEKIPERSMFHGTIQR